MDQGLRGQSACLYLLTDLRRFGRWLTSEFHQVARQRQPGHHSSRRIFLFDQLGKFNLIFFFLENNDYDFVLILKNKYSNPSFPSRGISLRYKMKRKMTEKDLFLRSPRVGNGLN